VGELDLSRRLADLMADAVDAATQPDHRELEGVTVEMHCRQAQSG
jgi:hypothetical protein